MLAISFFRAIFLMALMCASSAEASSSNSPFLQMYDIEYGDPVSSEEIKCLVEKTVPYIQKMMLEVCVVWPDFINLTQIVPTQELMYMIMRKVYENDALRMKGIMCATLFKTCFDAIKVAYKNVSNSENSALYESLKDFFEYDFSRVVSMRINEEGMMKMLSNPQFMMLVNCISTIDLKTIFMKNLIASFRYYNVMYEKAKEQKALSSEVSEKIALCENKFNVCFKNISDIMSDLFRCWESVLTKS